MLQSPDLPLYLIPQVDMEFSTLQKGYDLYNRYARHAGFGIRKGPKSSRSYYLYCTHQDKHMYGKDECERQRAKTTKQTACAAKMRLKERWDGTWVIADIQFEHNHSLDLTTSMLVFLQSHKEFDEAEMAYVQ